MSILYRSLFILGIIASIAVLIFAESGPVQPFQPVIPTFSNPFDERVTFTPSIIADGPNDVTNVSNIDDVEFCEEDESVFWGCVAIHDAEGSYVFDTSDFQFSVRYDSIPTSSGLPVLGLAVTVQCRTFAEFQVAVTNSTFGLQYQSDSVTCTSDNEFRDITVSASFVPTRPLVSDFTNGGIIFIGESESIDVSFLSITFFIGFEPECVSGDTLAYVGCLLSNFFGAFVRVIRFILSGFVYVAEWFVAIGQTIGNYIAVIVWLYAIPGMPAPIQAFVDAFLTVLFAVIAIEVYKLVKPFG